MEYYKRELTHKSVLLGESQFKITHSDVVEKAKSHEKL